MTEGETAIKKFPLLVADPTTNEQKICEWRVGTAEKLQKLVDSKPLVLHYYGSKEWTEAYGKYLLGCRKVVEELLEALKP